MASLVRPNRLPAEPKSDVHTFKGEPRMAEAGTPLEQLTKPRHGGGQFHPIPSGRPSNERHPQMTPSDDDHHSTPTPQAKGLGPPKGVAIRVRDFEITMSTQAWVALIGLCSAFIAAVFAVSRH